MYWTDDPVSDAERYFDEMSSRPYRCKYCGEEIDEDDVHFDIYDDPVCDDCWEEDEEDEEGEEE